MLLANGDLAFKGRSTNCSLGPHFWSENLLRAGDITGETSSRPFFPCVHNEQSSPSQKMGGKVGKTPKKELFWGSKENTWLGDISGVTSPWWGVDGTLCGCCSPSCSSFGWTLAKPQRRSDLGAPVTQFCHGSAPHKAFPARLGWGWC